MKDIFNYSAFVAIALVLAVFAPTSVDGEVVASTIMWYIGCVVLLLCMIRMYRTEKRHSSFRKVFK